MTSYRDDLIDHIGKAFPHCLNVRELRPEQCGAVVHLGDTVLHFAARNVEKNPMLCQWLGMNSEGEELPKTKPRTFYPIANLDPSDCNECAAGAAKREGCGRFGATAMHLTIKNSTHGTLMLLCKRLTTFLSPQHAVLLNDGMALLAVGLPEAVYEVLEEIDDRIFQEQELLTKHIRPDAVEAGKNASKSVRVEIDRDEVRCSDAFMATKHVPDDDDYIIPPNVDFIAERKHVWGSPPFQSESDEATKEPVRAFACGLAGLLADPSDEVWDVSNETGLGLSAPCTHNRTYSLIVENCGSEVYDCRTMKLATQFKWETSVHPMQVKMMRMYIFCTLLSTLGMLSCTHAYGYVPRVGDLNADGSAAFVAEEYGRFPLENLELVFLVLMTALGVQVNEMSQLSNEGPKKYMHSPWNFCDLVSSLSLIAACGCHFAANRAPEDWGHDWWEESLGVWGAVGVLFKWIGVLDYIRLWLTTASHVRMIASIGTDAMPFLVVILTVIIDVSLCYCIMMPDSVDFEYGTRIWMAAVT